MTATAKTPIAATPTQPQTSTATTTPAPSVAAVKLAPKAAVKRVAKKVAAPAKTAVTAPAAALTPTPAKVTPKAVTIKPVAKTTLKTSPQPIAKPKAEKTVKAKKPKLVRDSFTIPKAEYTVLDDLKQRATILNSLVKKSELIRAGIKALAAMNDTAFLAALKAVPTIKTGRPSKTKTD